VVDAAPGHVETVRELIIEPLTTDQLELLTQIGQRLLSKIDPDGTWPP
jgi:hypothetical protein